VLPPATQGPPRDGPRPAGFGTPPRHPPARRRYRRHVALFEPDAVVDNGEGRIARGHAEIRALFTDIAASGRKFNFSEQQAAVISGDLALTSTRNVVGNVSAEIARRQSDGTWLWVVDCFVIARE
jgi:hypothetical protein